MAEPTSQSFLMGSGARYQPFLEKGDSITGRVATTPELQNQTNMDTGAPLTFPDGNPKLMLRVLLDTDEREDEDDTGRRSVYIKGGNMQKAVAEAVRKAGADDLEVGGVLTLTYTGNGKATKKGYNPPKLFEASYRKPSKLAAAAEAEPDEDDDEEEEEAPQPVRRPAAKKAKRAPVAVVEEDDEDDDEDEEEEAPQPVRRPKAKRETDVERRVREKAFSTSAEEIPFS